MDFVNGTRMSAAYTLGLDPDGRERVVVVVKGTFRIPPRGGVAALADASDPLVASDTFTGKPGFSAVVYESDFAPFKPRCDVLLLGSAHVPAGREATSLQVGVRVDGLTKGFEVVGDRHWAPSMLGTSGTSAKPFRSMPITYDRAFGGPGDPSKDNPALRNAYAPNPVGVGYFKHARDEDIFARPLPNTQEINDPVRSPSGSYRPMSLGPIGRNFAARYPLAGTYDAAWLEDGFPFLPADFRMDYYQAAPEDQQIAYPRGGEEVRLLNLTPHEQAPFQLPVVEVPVEFTNTASQRTEQMAALDTVILEPDRGVMNLVWRTSLPLQRSLREITQIVIGRMPVGFYRARERQKAYYPSLGALVAAKRRRR